MKVLVIGSGPIVIGQAAEFDYAGSQACRSLREEGVEVVLINSNPATIMTDLEMSDALYIEPLNVDFCERVIAKERPDALLPTLGGQTGLNLATQLEDAGILDKYNVKVIGTPLSAIKMAEDRESFRGLMREIKEPVPESWIISTPEELDAILDVVPYPCIIRPAYTLGGTGGGIANTREELEEIGKKGLKLSMRSQIMVERSLLGWKEVEYEVMRDGAGNCITICNMENLDPMGVHTGDSIVVAPSQTLSDLEYHMLRTASLKIIQALGIEGGCNVQLAVNPDSFDYYVIEVNPRVSRSSALASKATGYPIARVAAKIALGKTLGEIENQVTRTTKACFEPALDYCVVKIPRWPFDKFASGDRTLFTQMKATGEVMAIDRTFESALMKAIRGLEVKTKDLKHPKFQRIQSGTDVSSVGTSGVTPESPIGMRDNAEIERRKGAYLPHWTQEGGTYHVVFRLADAVPEEVAQAWATESARLARLAESSPSQEIWKLRKALMDEVGKTLDASHGACVLSKPEVADVVEGSLKHFDGERYALHAWCVMPSHVHAIVQPLAGHNLAEILHSWKSFTAHEINKVLGLNGALWQPEYFDHLIRDDKDYAAAVEYVLNNPAAANLADWRWAGQGRDGLGTHGRDAHATPGMSDEDLREAIRKPTDERLWALAEGLRRNWTIQEINKISRVDTWFLEKILNLVKEECEPTKRVETTFKMVDTCAGEFESKTPYYYASSEVEDDGFDIGDDRKTVLVLGSGPIRIGQGIEFDYSCVHCVWALQKMGYRAIIINNNPETVSTDFDTGDGLYFEPVTVPDVLAVIKHENAIGAVTQFGGQTAINLAEGLKAAGVNVLGTSPEAIAMAEDREQFDALLEELNIPRPRGKAVRSLEEAVVVAHKVGFPVLVRPSFVLGGRAMEIVYDEAHLRDFYGEAEDANPGQPVLVDQYILGQEAEVDVVSDGEETLVPGIMEHIERAGIHSGDSMAVYPAVSLSDDVQSQMVLAACKIARALKVHGLMNIQFVISEGKAYVLEVNPRASRTVPYLSKVTGVPMVELATRTMMGEKLKDLGYSSGLWVLEPAREPAAVGAGGEAPCALPMFAAQFGLGTLGRVVPEKEIAEGRFKSPKPILYAIKAPVFSFQKLSRVEPSLGPEMKSTGEILGIDTTFEAALYKAMVASGIHFKGDGVVLLTVRDEDKAAAVQLSKGLVASGRKIVATRGTARILNEAGIAAEPINKISQGSPNLLELILSGQVSIMINTPSADKIAEAEAARIRRACIETGIPCVTSIDTASALLRALDVFDSPHKSSCLRLDEYFTVGRF